MMGEMREIKEAKGFGEWDRCPVASKCPRDSPVNTRVWADGYKGLWSSNSRLPHPKMQVGTSTSLALLAAPLLMWPGGYSHRVDPEPPRSQKLVFRVPLSRRPGAHRLAEPALVPAKSQGPASHILASRSFHPLIWRFRKTPSVKMAPRPSSDFWILQDPLNFACGLSVVTPSIQLSFTDSPPSSEPKISRKHDHGLRAHAGWLLL